MANEKWDKIERSNGTIQYITEVKLDNKYHELIGLVERHPHNNVVEWEIRRSFSWDTPIFPRLILAKGRAKNVTDAKAALLKMLRSRVKEYKRKIKQKWR